MIRRIFLLCALVGASSVHVRAQAQLGGGKLDIKADVQILTADASGRPYLRDTGVLLEADEIQFEPATQKATAIGRVVLTRGADRLLADRLVFERATGRFTAENIRLGRPPYFAEAFSAEGSRKEITLHRARVSYGEPGPWQPTWNADTITYGADGKVRSENSQIGIGHVQPLPFPKFQQDLKQPFAGAASFTGGYRRSLGAFADAVVLVPVTPDVRLGADVGLFTSRGLMVGPAGRYFSSDEEQRVRGSFRSGYINDRGDKGVDLLGDPVPENRGYIEWQHEQAFSEHLELKAQLNWWKDSEVLRDFRPRAFFPVQVPDTFAEATYAANNVILSLFARAQPNQFHQVQQRLPELRLDLLPMAVGNGFYARFNGSAALLRERYAETIYATAAVARPPVFLLPPSIVILPGAATSQDFVPLPTATVGPGIGSPGPGIGVAVSATPAAGAVRLRPEGTRRAARLDAYYGLERPFAPEPWLAFTPVAGARVTQYSDVRVPFFTVGLTNPPSSSAYLYHPGDTTRTMGEVGFDAALRTAGTFEYKNPQWKIDGLRHLLTPRLSYRYIGESHSGSGWIPPIDRDAFSTYLPPLGLGEQRNVDELRAANVLRLGFDNILQTRDAKDGTRDLVALNIANDFRFKRRRGERDVSEIHADLSLTPVGWLRFDLYQSFAPQNFTLRELNSSLTLRSGNAWSLRFSNNYLRGQIEDYLVDGRVRINEAYEAITRLHYDTRRSRFNEQAYGIAHNLGNTWLISYSVSLYSGRRRESSFGFNVQIDTVRF